MRMFTHPLFYPSSAAGHRNVQLEAELPSRVSLAEISDREDECHF